MSKRIEDERKILIKNAEYVVTMDPQRRVLQGSSLLLVGNRIAQVGGDIDSRVNQTIDATGMVVYPGFINTHLHSPQVFHRHSPAQQNKPIAEWISVTTSINRELDPEAAYYGSLICFAELMLSGVTTSLDYFYPFVKEKQGTFEAMIQAAKKIGIRLTAVRGSMSQSKEQGTLYDKDVVEPTEEILAHSENMINKHHDSRRLSMTRVGVGPCLPFASLEEDYVGAAMLARRNHGVIMQTHTAESKWEVDYCVRRLGFRPVELMERAGFLGPDVSLIHGNIINDEEISLLGRTGTNIVLTPICNTRDAADGNGIAPFTRLIKAGANISIGTDGPASNDSMNIQDEMRYLRVVSRGKEGLYWDPSEDQAKYSYLDPLAVLAIANLGGARTLGRDDIGSIKVGNAADLAIFDPDHEISHAGAVNKWGAIMSCSPIKPKYSIVNGEIVVSDGHLTRIDEDELNSKFRKIHKEVIGRAERYLNIDLVNY